MKIDIDLRSKFPGARDQGPRPTCLAFAISDAHMGAVAHSELFSPDYLHYHATQLAGVSVNAGVSVPRICTALRSEGQPTESACPYSDQRPDLWSPPTLAPLWRCDSSLASGRASATLEGSLRAGVVNVLTLRISRSFHFPDPATYLVKEDGRNERRFHAVAVVGMGKTRGDVAFLARNSWGSRWGDAGHAWLPASYVDARVTAVVAMKVH
jgi:hypothetical protein